MPRPLRLQLRIEDPENVLWPVMGLFTDYLARGRYGAKRVRRYTASVLHWAKEQALNADPLPGLHGSTYFDRSLVISPMGSQTRRSQMVRRSAGQSAGSRHTRTRLVRLHPTATLALQSNLRMRAWFGTVDRFAPLFLDERSGEGLRYGAVRRAWL